MSSRYGGTGWFLGGFHRDPPAAGCLLLCLWLVSAAGPWGSAAVATGRIQTAPQGGQTAPDRPQPHYDYRERAQPYAGPGREEPDFAGLKEVVVGYFGPPDPHHPEHGDLWLAAQIAVEDINQSGGCRGLPLRLEPVWSENPWSTGIAQVARLIYTQPVVAVIGSVDGPSTHLAEQVVAKARVPLVNPGATDRSANLANVPWMFSCLPGEQDQLAPLITELLARAAGAPYALVSAVDHDSRIFTGELRRLLSRRGTSPAFHFEVADPEAFDQLERLGEPGLAAVIVVAGPADSARLLQRIRTVFSGPVFGSVAMGRRVFLDAVRDLPGEVIFPYPADPEAVEAFSRRFMQRTGIAADFASAQTYDAVRLLCEAIRRSGFNRVRLHDALREMVPWTGSAAGPINWDRTGQNTRPVRLVRRGCGEPMQLPARSKYPIARHASHGPVPVEPVSDPVPVRP